ncbi:retrovirus-related pol polyprotein from transposon TNT 1-94 [Tanacetum coccineum]
MDAIRIFLAYAAHNIVHCVFNIGESRGMGNPVKTAFLHGTIDPTLFIRRFDDDILVVQVYVDDIIFGSRHPMYTQLFSDLMKSRFEMSMIGEMTFFLGLQVNQSPRGIFINQSNYVLEILKKYGMETCDPVGTPMEIKDKLDLDQNGSPVDATKYRSMIGALMYLTSSRPDIVHATCLCARYQAKPTEKHLKEVKRIFRYLRGTVNMGLWYTKDSGFELTGFSYADYARCKDTFKSTSGGAHFLGEKLVSWSSKKQDRTTLSTAEAKYVSLSACCAQVLWMRIQLTDYGFHFNNIPIYCDLKSAIAISCNPVQHSQTKHIAVRYHFIKEHVEKGTIELYFVKTDYQLADLFTKALPVDRFNYLVCRLGRCLKEKLSGSNFNDWFRSLKLVLRDEKKLSIIEQPIPPAHAVDSEAQVLAEWNAVYDAHNEVACLMFGKEGKSVSSNVLKMKGYVEQLECLGNVLLQDLSVGLITNDLISDFAGFVVTPQVMAIEGGKIHKANKKSLNAKGEGKVKGNGKDKSYIPKPKNLKPSAKEHPTKDDACHHCKEVGHWKRNCLVYLAELVMKKKQVGTASSLVSKNDVLYFNFIPCNGIYEIDMLNLVPNVNSIYNVSNKRAKHNLDSTYLWHCRLAHISKKRIEKLQYDRLLKSTDEESFDKCVSCLSGQMTRNPFPYSTIKGRTVLFGLIPYYVCGPLWSSYQDKLTSPYTPQHNDMSERRNRTLLDMVRSMMNLITLSLSFLDYALEYATCILNMVPTKKVDKTPYELWYAKVPNLSYLKETMGYYFYFPPKNKIVVASKLPMEVEGFEPPQEEVIPVRRSARAHRVPDCLCLKVEVEEHSLGDFNEPANYKAAILDPESDNLQSVKSYIGKCFAMKDLGEATFILGIKIYRDRLKRLIGLSQSAYMDKILKRYRMDNSKRGNIPMQERFDLNKTQGASTPGEVKQMQNVPYALAVGSIMYAVRCTRPDVAFGQNITSCFQQNPGEPHWTAVKTILKYLRNTKDMFLVYGGNPKAKL